MDANLYLALAFLMGPPMVIGIAAFFVLFRFYGPIAAELNVSIFDRNASRRVFFGGITNADPELKVRVKKFRLCLFACYAAFFVHVSLAMGIGAALFLGSFFVIGALLTRPYEPEESHS